MTTFASYTPAEVIGEGGAGRVFAAIDEAGRQWAVKVLSASRATSERRKRFKNEILFSERMKHARGARAEVGRGVANPPGGGFTAHAGPLTPQVGRARGLLGGEGRWLAGFSHGEG